MEESPKIKKVIAEISNVIDDYNTFIDYSSKADEDLVVKAVLDKAKASVTQKLGTLQKLSLTEDYYFFDCPFEVYKKNYENNVATYIAKHVDLDESDFIKNELKSRLERRKNRILKPDNIHYDYFVERDCRFLIKSEEKKVHFLRTKLNKLGWDSKISWNKSSKRYIIKWKRIENIDEVIDLDTNKTTLINDSKEKEYPKHIFLSYKAYDYYIDCMQFLDAIDENNKIYKVFSAKANAVYRNKFFKENIFKPSLTLKDYIDFLVEEFDFKITSKLSIPLKHEHSVDNFISKYPYSEQDE